MMNRSLRIQTTPVVTLTRNIRFSLTRTLDLEATLATPRGNTHAGWPSMDTIAGSAWDATIEIRGVPDPRTGYLVGINHLDQAVRANSIPKLLETYAVGECSAACVARTILETAGPAPGARDSRGRSRRRTQNPVAGRVRRHVHGPRPTSL